VFITLKYIICYCVHNILIYIICYCVHNIIIYIICYCVHNIIIYNICFCVHNIIVLLVLIQQRRDSADAWSNSRADWPELRDDRLNVEIFQLGAKIAPPQTPQTRRPEKYRVYRSHKRLYVDFSWDSVARKNRFAFGVNAPLDSYTSTRYKYIYLHICIYIDIYESIYIYTNIYTYV